MVGSSLSQDSIFSEKRSPSMLPYEEEDEQRSAEVPPSFSTQRSEVVQLPPSSKHLEQQILPSSSAQRRTEVLLFSSNQLEQEVSSSSLRVPYQLVRIPILDSFVVPPSGASDTLPSISKVSKMALSPPSRIRTIMLPSGKQLSKVCFDRTETVPSVPHITSQASSSSKAQENDMRIAHKALMDALANHGRDSIEFTSAAQRFKHTSKSGHQ
ncbi:hypothetical protein P9112_013712 [Eukaryota sp. TZLM1-RC]